MIFSGRYAYNMNNQPLQQNQANGYVDSGNSAPLNSQASAFQMPAWQATSRLVGTVWISQDTRALYIYDTIAFAPAD